MPEKQGNRHGDEHHFHKLERLLIKQHDVVLRKINELQIKLKVMGKELDDLNAQLDRQDTAITGVTADIAFIKAKLEGSPGGLTSAEVATLLARVTASADKLEALDSETDSSGA